MKSIGGFLKGIAVAMLFALAVPAFAQNTATGVITDALGPVPGASVLVQGTHNGTITADDGTFTLSGVRKGDVLEIACLGYTSKTVVFDGQRILVTLDEDSEMLEGTVVTALGIRKDEKKVGYAVASVSADNLNATASPSLGSALYGKAAGVRVTTAPGGATGAISINVRGISSITGTSQPLIIVDGVPVRNGDANNSDYWSDQRVNSNGLTDINVEDIENLTILKGASATSLYGSEGANGVVLITMKQGKKNSGVHVDFNASVQADQVAYMPTYQTTFGPGYPYLYWFLGLEEDVDSPNYGFLKTMGKDRAGRDALSPQNTYYYFGPKYDGRMVYTPTGYREFSPITSNPWSDVFRTGITQQYNIAVQQGGEHGHFRFSYTFMDNIPNQYNSHLGKHNFQVSGSQDITSNGAVKLGYSVNYMNQNVKNRPYRTSRLVTNYGGMFGSFDPVGEYRERTVTSAGYQNRVYTSNTHENPIEGWDKNPAVSALIGEYFWNILGKEQLENNNRLIASVTPSWQIVKGLTLKGSIATDYTTQKQENKDYAGTNTALAGSYQGYYGIQHREYTTVYGDAMLNWDKNLTDDINLNTNIGWSARREQYSASSAGTNGGLTVENWFNLAASAQKANAGMGYSDFLKQAYFGTVSLSYKDWAYLEGTLRNEKTSTLRNQSYWYPSVNGSVIFSELFNLPAWVDYGKFRVSYGEVGNAPALYKAPLSYSQSSASGYVYNQLGMNVGNDAIRPERTKEWELGIEGKFLNNRAGFEVSWYNKKIVDQILETTVPATSGVTSMLMNIGILQNRGLEVAAYATPIETRDWRVDISGNVAWNKNKVLQLAEGVDRLQHARWDNGAAYLYSYPGETMGDIYAFAPLTDDKGNYVVDGDGFYKVTEEPVKVGNAMADLVGGFALALNYRRWTLDMNFNFQIGGTVFNMPYQYMMGLGTLTESMPYRDLENGGIAYYTDDSGKNVAYTGTDKKGPNGATVHYDGRILPGVKEDGTPNDQIISQEYFLEETYGWGVGGYLFYSHAMFDNTYLKCREITLTYSVPDSLLRKFKCNNLRLSAFARNPFYIYKNLPIFDAESTDGTNWTSQVCIGGSTSTTRTYGVSLRVNF